MKFGLTIGALLLASNVAFAQVAIDMATLERRVEDAQTAYERNRVVGDQQEMNSIDSRFGVEVWGFVPMNLLPKLRTLVDGQPVGSFAHFVDSSPKISDVKYDDKWHTSLIFG